MTGMMVGFPPSPETQVTLANWRQHPYSTWAFSNVRELLPTANIAHDPANVRTLGTALEDLGHVDLGDGMTLARYLDATWTDGYVVLQDGAVVHETYRNAAGPTQPHILMSVSKSMLGVLAGILAHKGKLDLSAPVTVYVPEVRSTAWNKATVQNVLDMRVGILFDEDYEATSGPIVEYRKSTGWNPLGPGDTPSDLRSFFSQLTETDGPHEGRFHYVSPNTDLAAWIIERATGTRYADLMSQHLWQPMGAGDSAYITVDRLGAPRAAGGMCVTARDLARVGQLIVDGGMAGTTQVIAPEWIDDLFNAGDPAAWAKGDFVDYFNGRDMHYRNKWYVLRGDRPMAFGSGIHGQNLWVLPHERVVIAKTSSRPMAQDAATGALNLKMVDAVKRYLAE